MVPDYEIAGCGAMLLEGTGPISGVLSRHSLTDRTENALCFCDRRYPLEEIVAARRHVEAGHENGNVVIVM